MDTISSAEFRKCYASLDRPVIVTANGHPIGVWHPASTDLLPPQPRPPAIPATVSTGRSSSRPFTPVPKIKGK